MDVVDFMIFFNKNEKVILENLLLIHFWRYFLINIFKYYNIVFNL